MSSIEVFRRIIAALDEAGIPHMLTGSFASSLHGLTRATQDIDLATGWKVDLIVRRDRPFSVQDLPGRDFHNRTSVNWHLDE